MSDLVSFLTARLDEDEKIASVLAGDKWGWPQPQPGFADHVARHSPARVLREVEAKRAIVALHEPLPSSYGEPSVCPSCWPQPWIGTHPLAPCPTMRNLAAVYSDHPDYDPEWSPGF